LFADYSNVFTKYTIDTAFFKSVSQKKRIFCEKSQPDLTV